MRTALTAALAVLAIAAGLVSPAAADHSVAEHLSIGPAGGNGPNPVDWITAVTPDGKTVFFTTAERLTADDTDSAQDIYRRSGANLTRVSTGPAGGNGEFNATLGYRPLLIGSNAHKFIYGISDDGSVAVFETAEQLVVEDTDNEHDLYKWADGTTTLLSIGPNGENGPCNAGQWGTCNEFAGISQDGRHVFFNSSGHLIAGDEETALCSGGDPEEGTVTYNQCSDVFENDDGVVRLVSTGPNDPHDAAHHELSDNSIDGETVVFESYVALLSDDTDAFRDVYQRHNGTLSIVSPGPEFDPFVLFRFLSEDGSAVILWNGPHLWERSGGLTRQRTATGGVDQRIAGASPDAEHIFFYTRSALVPQDTDSCLAPPTNGCLDIYGHSFADGIRLITNGSAMGNVDTGLLYQTSHQGNKAYFLASDQLDPADTDNAPDVFEYDLVTGTTKLISTGPTDVGGTTPGFIGASEDGSRVFFGTVRRMVAEDINNAGDAYERVGNTTYLISRTPNWTQGASNAIAVSRDGSIVVFDTPDARLTASDTDSVRDVFSISRGDLTGYIRPIGATPFRVPLVQAEQACASGNRTHGPPLAFPSCAPPTPRSSYLNAGVGDGSPYFAKSSGHVRLDVVTGAPGGTDDSDVGVRVLLTNVWWVGGTRVDYTGGLQASLGLRITNKDGAIPNTIEDRTLPVDVPCTTTADDTVGSTCSVWTTADAVSPGIVPEGSRTIWGLGQVQVRDGGPDGDVHTDPAVNQVFAVQGLFVP